jgi:hypothetical protein
MGLGPPTGDSLLHEKARAAVQAGEVPKRAPDEIRSGPGTGGRCVVCGELTVVRGAELEIEFSRGPDAGRYLVHVGCFLALKRFF